MRRFARRVDGLSVVALGLTFCLTASLTRAEENVAVAPFESAILADAPALYLDFDEAGLLASILPDDATVAVNDGKPLPSVSGPRPPRFPEMAAGNRAGSFAAGKYLRLKSSGDSLRVDQSGEITIEAWVRPTSLGDDLNRYVIGKGRNDAGGPGSLDQNWALRLRGEGGRAQVSFLFRSAPSEGHAGDWHRWSSDDGFVVDGSWHHVAVTYVFGKPDSVRGYLDGRPVAGTWDMGGPTTAAPAIGPGEIWVGSALGGSAGNTFVGDLDEIAVHAQALSPETLGSRFAEVVPDPVAEHRERMLLVPPGKIRLAILEQAADGLGGSAPETPDDDVVLLDRLCLTAEPRRYGPDGAILARANPHLIRVGVRREFPPGDYEFLVRSRGPSRLIVDGVVHEATGPVRNADADGYDEVQILKEPQVPGMHAVPFGTQESVVPLSLSPGEHGIEFESVVGGKLMRAELGETLIAYRPTGVGHFRVLAADPADDVELTEAWWLASADERHDKITALNGKLRGRANHESDAYWAERRVWARRVVEAMPPIAVPEASGVALPIDRFLAEKMTALGVEPGELVDDATFARRATIDVLGRRPSAEEIARFESLPAESRRAAFIDELLADDEWADNWVAYWQDVLAENPGILKPELNNTGPFRYWLHEAALDNLPMDRFASELLAMRGDRLAGGAGGFEMASQNDLPMADKAHIAAQAFLGVDMKCARCHDAPFHPWRQEQLLNLAAMLERKTITLPATSTVPPLPGGRVPAIEITLEPGAKVEPAWAFDEFPVTVAKERLRKPDDTRELAAFLITSPENERFAQTIVNRVWKRLMGQGLVEPVDDWTQEEPSHPDLLAWLGREFVRDGHDLKALVRRIMATDAYQRVATTPETFPEASDARSFATQTRRRMSAEGIVDSLFAMAGKPFHSEPMTLEQEGRRPIDTFLHFGRPRKAWEFVNPSAERDRPALIMPMTQSLVDVLSAYGWRDARPSPVSVRDEEPNSLQPLAIANGLVPQRLFTMSDDHAVTALALEDVSIAAFVDALALRVWGRHPDEAERELLIESVRPGFDARRRLDEPLTPSPLASLRSPVSWSNHLNPDATIKMLELEKVIKAGDPPTRRLDPEWRARAEDLLWAMANSPEYVFVP